MSHSICGGKIVIDQGTCQRVSDAGVSFDICLVKCSLHIKTEVETETPRLGKRRPVLQGNKLGLLNQCIQIPN